MYQAPQSAYDLFDKALVLYEGRQIYFGPASKAKEYFVNLGFECPSRQTTPDFLTSMTFPAERITRIGSNPPRTPDEFAEAWKGSAAYRSLQVEIAEYKALHPIDGQDADAYRKLKKSHQAKGQRLRSPYTLTYIQQVQLCVWRAYRRLKADPTLTLTMSIGSIVMALIISSLFYNLEADTSSFHGRAVVLFVAVLFNAFSSMLEILTLYAQRPIVEKQSRYAFYHPSAESYASVLVDLPVKIVNTISFNMVFYFMTNLNRAPGPFFFYLLVVFFIVLAMSGIFRSV
jgi:ATP-binding cassette subfamily G (WHITE) protein 2 (PDR)